MGVTHCCLTQSVDFSQIRPHSKWFKSLENTKGLLKKNMKISLTNSELDSCSEKLLASTPTMEITKTGDKWKMVTATALKSVVLEFELGVPFDEDTTDGRKCKTTVTMEGDNKIITSQKAQKSGQKDVTVIREFSDKGIHVQMICEDVTSVQFFDRT